MAHWHERSVSPHSLKAMQSAVASGVTRLCEDDGAADDSQIAPPSGLTRRRFLQSTGSLAAAAAVLGTVPHRSLAATTDGSLPVSMAMHIHSSFSEGEGSMAAHLLQAETNDVDVLWWTDHDHRMSAVGYREAVHFTSLTDESPAPGEGDPWLWQRQTSGPLTTASTGGIVSEPASPLDPVPGGSLQVRAESKDNTEARLGFYAESAPARWNYRCNLTGQALFIEVLPIKIGRTGYLELRLASSYHPAQNGRSDGAYQLSYRFRGRGRPDRRSATERSGVVNVVVDVGEWNSVVLRPAEDIAALWPDMDARDFALVGVNLNAVSTGRKVNGYFDYLRFSRQTSGDVPLRLQGRMQAEYAQRHPTVTQQQGLEVSLGLPHVNWFGGAVTLPDYGGVDTNADYKTLLEHSIVPDIHGRGGLVSYNHPFGPGSGVELSPFEQDDKLAEAGAALVGNRALGCDLLEVGYPVRGGADLAHHVALWDICSRNAIFLTGNGTSDDHVARDWFGSRNNWVTSAWAAGTEESALLAALAAGRAWCGSLSGYRGSLDLLVDGTCPMGSVSTSGLWQRHLKIIATDLPAGASVQVVQGLVDYAGSLFPFADTRVIATYRDAELAGGAAVLSVDTSSSSFVRTQVLDGNGQVVGLSNPVWLLREAPAGGIPEARGH